MPDKAKSTTSIRPTLQRLLKIGGKQSAWLYLALFCELGITGGIILNAVFLRNLFNAVLAGNSNAFWFYTWLVLSFSVPNILFNYLRTWSIGRFSERVLARLRQTVAGRSAVLPVSYLEERHSGDMLSVLNADLGKVKTLLANNILDFFAQSARGIAALIYIVSINWWLALVTVVLTPAIFLLINTLTRPIAKRSEEMQTEIGQVNSIAQDALAGAMVVKSFNLADIQDERFHQANSKALKKGFEIARYWSLINGAGFGLIIAPFIIAMGIGGYLIIDKQMSFGALFAFINLLNYVVNPLGGLPGIIASMSESTGAAQRVFQILDQPAERQDGERQNGAITRPKTDRDLALQFKDVSFAYADGKPVLKDIHLDIRRGQTVAIVGPSGGGKSTVLKLILGYYPLPDGRVRLFGDSLNDWQLAEARQQMAFVAQDTYLFPVSIAENIRCGKPDATQEEIERAARLANIHDFIASLPDGYQTSAGEWGARLSGGQKQRISLARAILKDAPILLLDEPTSALDAESESLIQEALNRFTRDRTTVVVAHRLSTIKNADRVLVLNDGQIVEDGTHEELIARGGMYLDLYQRQFALDQPAGLPDQGIGAGI
jgi:subfamily B ATP-binding cassette protein MsbA/ATP-binding cassette subfamily B protein AbcA/BmrA